jgi:ubiquinone/menaquinone biosynthesis C-methylase UbiE
MQSLVFLVKVLKSLLWITRRNESDIVDLYNSITPFVKIAINNKRSDALNFGYWTQNTPDPLKAQEEMCRIVAELADLNSGKRLIVADVGSGFSAPALQWKLKYNNYLDVICVDINFKQLSTVATMPAGTVTRGISTNDYCKARVRMDGDDGVTNASILLSVTKFISFVNATATTLPFADQCIDRIIALESAQHFKPLQNFFSESKRILKTDGLFVVAIPIINSNLAGNSSFVQFLKLGILYFSWASEHYSLKYIKSALLSNDFNMEDVHYIGHSIYEPVVDYYIKNRRLLKQTIIRGTRLSSIHRMLFEFVEYMVYRSALKMRYLSGKGMIDYVLVKATKK